MPQTSAAKRSLGQRLNGKVGPLPAWAWAAIILGAYLAYTHFAGGGAAAATTSTSTDATPSDVASSDNTPVTSDSGNPPASGGGGPADNVNDTLLSQLSGFGSSIDALTAAVQSAPAFQDVSGTSGSADFSGGSSPLVTLPALPAPAAPKAAVKAAPKPAAKPVAVHYYTYAPGKAPKGQAGNQAPASVPGKTLHFTKGKGYYYA